MSPTASLEDFRARAQRWLSAQRGQAQSAARAPSTAVFHTLSHDDERRIIHAAAAWQRAKYEAGYGALTWPGEYGGAELDIRYQRVFEALEREYNPPADHELRRITTNLVAPTIRDLGSPYLRDVYVRKFLTCDELVCQLFSEPDSGSDLAGVNTRAELKDGAWTITGAKVWVSGAQFADHGLLLARSDPSAAKHAGITAFLLPMRSAGVDVRPIRQMTGGTSFNEVFLDGVHLDDRMRIGDIGSGWTVARTMLTYERNQSGSKAGVGGSWEMLRDLAVRRPDLDAAQRDLLVKVFLGEFSRLVTRQRAEQARSHGAAPGPEGSIGKLTWADSLTAIGEAAASVVGLGLIADRGVADGFAWSEHVLGAPGFHIAGGTDEIQRNIIAEGILGLPRDPHPRT